MKPKRILIVRLSAFGDIVQTLPLLAEIRRLYPEATIGWLVEEAGASLLEGNTALDVLHIAKRKTWLKQLKSPLKFFHAVAEIGSFIAALKAQRYTVVIDVQGLLKSAIWGWLAGIPKRIGFTPAREQAFRFYTHTHASFHPIKSTLHATQEFLSLLTLVEKHYAIPTVDALQYPIFQPLPPLSADAVAQFIPPEWLSNRQLEPIILLAPCTAWASKQWGRQQWVTLAGLLIEAGFKVVWIGSKADVAWFTPLFEALGQQSTQQRNHWVSWVGETSLQQLYRLFSSVDCLVGADSVAFHLANAHARNHPHQSLKLVGLFGATKPTRTGATFLPEESVATMLQTKEALPCMPCHQRNCLLDVNAMACMQGLLPQQVFDSIQLLVKNNLAC